MFADYTNHFYEHRNIIKFFAAGNEKLMNINDWFMVNKLSLNVGRTKYSLFSKPSKVDDLPLMVQNFSFQEMKRVPYIKFLGVLLNDNLSWKEHLKYIENKIAKSIRFLYKAKDSLFSL